jgi:hypothetical protein
VSSYEAAVELHVYEAEPGEWRAQGVGAPVFVFAGTLPELEVEAARILSNYLDWIAERRPDREAFRHQCDQLGFEVQFSDAPRRRPEGVYFISRRGIPAQKVTVLLQGTLVDD